MFNKKVLIEALKKVNAAKAPAKKKDIEVSLEGQWKGKGEYRIPSNQITMEGVDFPVIGKPNVGPPIVMEPEKNYQFSEDVSYVDETPLDMAKKGGIKSKKYSKSLLATNKLYKKNPLYKKKNYKSKTYDPMAMYFQPGGSKTTYYNYGEPWYYNKNKYKKVGNQWYISNDVTDFKWQPIKDPTGNRAKELNKNATVDPSPWIQNPNTIEGKINAAMGDPQSQAARASAFYAPPNEDDKDNLRHGEGSRRTQQAIAKATGSDLLGYFGAIGLGAAHELGTMFSDPRPWGVVTQEAYEDIKNNNLGAEMGYFHTPNATKRLNYLAQTYQIPDGYGEVKPFPGSNWTDPYDQIQRQKAQQEVWNNPNPKPVSLTEKFADGGPTKPGCRPVPPTASEIQSQVLSEGKGPTAEGAARVKRAAEARAAWEKRCGAKPVAEVKPEIKFEEKPKRKLGQLGPQSFKNGGDISIPDLNQYKKGGYIEMKLTPEEIKKYVAGGHVVEDISNYKKGGALLTKKVTCKKCGWEWDAADGGNDMTTCHKCGGEGLIHAQPGMIVRNAEGIGRALKGTSEFRNMMNTLNEAGEILPSGLPASVNLSKTSLPKVDIPIPKVEIPKFSFSPTRVAASRPIPPSGFSPIRMGDDYLHKGSEWVGSDPEDYASIEDWKKLGLQDASDSLKSFLSKLPPYGPDTFKGIGDFNFKDFSQGSNFRRDMLAAAAGPQRQLSTEDFFTDDELVRMANQQADYWNARDQFDLDNPEDPANMMFNAFTGDRSRDELFSLLYPNASMPNFRSKFMTPRQEKLTTDIIGPFTPSIDKKGMLSRGSLNTSVNSYSKDIPSEAAKLSSFQKGDDWLMTAPAEIVVGEMRGGLGLKMEDVKNATPEQLEKWRQQIVSRMQKQAQERYKALLGNPFTAGDAYSKMTLNKYGGVPKAQAGLIKGAQEAYKAARPFLKGANIATLGTLNSLAKQVPVMINPLHIGTFGFSAGERAMVGPFTGSPLNMLPFYGKDLAKEMGPNEAFRYFGDNLDYVKLTDTLDSAHGPLLRKGRNQILQDKGQWFEQGTPNASYSTVFGVRANPSAPGSNLRYMPKGNRNGVLIGDMSTSNPRIINPKDPGLTFYRRLPLSDKLSPVDLDNPWDWKNYAGNLQSLAERYGYAAAYGAALAGMGHPFYQETLDKYVNEPVSRFVENSKKQMEDFLKGSPVKKK